MPVARPESSDSRIIAHIDMDCFYVQVEQRKQPHLRGLPTAVVQYNEWKGGGLIAVSYEARKFGVKRSMRGDEAKKVCPQIQLVQVPVARGKADLSTYRNAGSEVVSILSQKGRCERASIDEVYLDLTDAAEAMLKESPPSCLEAIDEEALKSHVLGLEKEESVKDWLCSSDADHRDKLLACAVLIVADLRMQVLKETEFTCSAGIAHNKMLAKLASGMNKPAQQTIVPLSCVKDLLDSLPIKKMKQLGGKLGSSLQSDLGVNTVGDLLKFSEEKLQDCYGINTGTWLWNIARGIDGEEVQGRLLPKSHGAGKTFPGPRALRTIDSVQHWINQLSEELSDRLSCDLDQNKRIAHTLTVHATASKSTDTESYKKFPSKSCPLRYGTAKIQEDSFNLFQAALREYLGLYGPKIHRCQQNEWRITSLSVSASKIIEIPSKTSILKYFHGPHESLSLSKQMPNILDEEAALSTSSGCESYSNMKPDELPIDYTIYSGDHLDQETTPPEDQVSPGFSARKATDGFTTETSLLLPSDSLTESKSCSGLNKNNSPGHLSRGGNISIVPNLKEKKQKCGAIKEKGTILKLFNSYNSSLSSAKPDATAGGSDASEVELRNRKETWNYKMEEIDPSVIDELPEDIQDELRAWLRPNKRCNVAKRGSTISHYFQPSKST